MIIIVPVFQVNWNEIKITAYWTVLYLVNVTRLFKKVKL